MLLYGKMEEEWRDTGYEKYQGSNLGNFRRKLTSGMFKDLKGSMSNGYKYLDFKPKEGRNEKAFKIAYHVLIMKMFVGERPDGMVIDHIDRNRLNNHISNLRYVTQHENCLNSSIFRTDILETDKRKRKNIINNQSAIKTGANKQSRNPRGTGSISIENGYYRASIYINKVRFRQQFKNREDAEKYLKEIIESQKI